MSHVVGLTSRVVCLRSCDLELHSVLCSWATKGSVGSMIATIILDLEG